METACLDLLQRGNAEVFLVEVSKSIDLEKDGKSNHSANAERVSQVLLQQKYKSILDQLGWELLGLISPHLLPASTHAWHLVHQIATVCRPKEMVLALLEQMERLSQEKPLMTFMMLGPLSTVMERLMDSSTAGVFDSSLRSVSRLLKTHFLSIPHERNVEDNEKKGRTEEGRSHGVVNGEDKEEEEESGIEEVARDAGGDDSSGEDEYEDSRGRRHHVCPSCELTVCDAVELTLEFVQPLVECVRSSYKESNGGDWRWTCMQTCCIDMLLSLLGSPLVEEKLSLNKDGQSGPMRRLAEDVMVHLRLCHCNLMESSFWLDQPSVTLTRDEDEGGHCSSPPSLGLGCYAYLLLAEKLSCNALPSVYSLAFFFSSSLKFCKVLLERQKNVVTKKGMKLLEVLLSRLPDHTLQHYLLDNRLYMDVAKVLVNVMTLCQVKAIRQEGLKHFEGLIRKFDASGRHKFYQRLLRTASHSGVRGVLVHSVKEEVAEALDSKCTSGDAGVFLGSSLVPILEAMMTIETGLELMKEIDRIMATLNLLRFLLLRDKKEINKSGVWDVLDSISEKFLVPLRDVLTTTQAHCRNETKLKKEELQTARCGSGRGNSEGSGKGLKMDGPEMTVQLVGGELLPEPNLDEQMQMLAISGHHLDMLESVLVRVEELAS